MAKAPAPAVGETPPLEEGPHFPGGEQMPAYRYAVYCFVLMFLMTVCIGLLHYLGMFLKR
jgi:hypothetical protein